jgi:hypothetical protein
MKITRRQLRQIIKEELSRLDESMSVDTMESLENAVKSGDREELKRVLKVAYEEGMRSYSPDQRVIGIPGKTEDRPVDSDPHTEVVNTLTSLVKSMLDDTPSGDPDIDGDGLLGPGELRLLADELEGEGQQSLESFRIPYRNYGYEGRRIISRDRAWLEFVPKGSGSQTRDDMFRAVTLLDSDDPEIGLAMATVHAPKSAGPLEQYDVYSVYATTTG